LKTKKEKNDRYISIIAILIGIISISVAFTAFSSTLKIKSKVNFNPNLSNFNVDFSTELNDVSDGEIEPIMSSTAPYDENFVASGAVVVNDKSSRITNLNVTFTAPGQEVSYVFYAHNIGKYNAYLKSIAFTNVQNETSSKVCIPLEDSNDSSIYSACDAISISLSVGNLYNITGSKADIDSHILDKNAAEKVVVTIKYNEGYAEPDESFEVLFGDIVLAYSSVN